MCATAGNERAVAAQASIVFLGSAQAGETLVAEAAEAATSGRSGVTRVSVNTADGRPVANRVYRLFTDAIGGALVDV
jgi:acyl-CoA thioesterase